MNEWKPSPELERARDRYIELQAWAKLGERTDSELTPEASALILDAQLTLMAWFGRRFLAIRSAADAAA
jgi:hypothetical protein